MKAKFPILIAAGLFFASVSKAQYPGAYVDARVVLPGRAVISYNNMDTYGYYNDRRDWRDGEYEDEGRRHERREEREDCRDYRDGRRDYYRDGYGYRAVPYCAPRRAVIYGY